jgi:cytochrome c oxidase subunit 1
MATVASTITAPVPDVYRTRLVRVTLVWVLTALVLFPVLAILGVLMRTQQSGYLEAMPPELFYAILTLHGLGMVGLWFVAGMAVISVLLAS